MRVCEVCGARFRGHAARCPLDGGPLRDLPDPMVGRVFAGRYAIGDKIGTGGMSVVYRARDKHTECDVAVKFLLPDLAANDVHRRRFLREVRAANRIDHPNVIRVFDCAADEQGYVYLVMEYLVGGSVADGLALGPLGARRAVDIAAQCASALARAHELDVIHRDIKPENIFLLQQNGMGERRPDFVKVLDFGLAHVKDDLRLTANGAVFGTPEYISPEQARGAGVTGAADLYALGCVLFEMMVGEPPFEGTMTDLVLRHLRDPAPRLSDRLSGVHPRLDDLVARLLEKNPRRRPADAHQLCEELREIAIELGPESSLDPVLNGFATEAGERPVGDEAVVAQLQSQLLELRSLARRKHGSAVPEWLSDGINELERELADSASHVKGSPRPDGSLDAQLTRALAELMRDEARSMEEARKAEERLTECQTRLRELASRLAHASPDRSAAVDRAWAVQARKAGLLAADWLETEQRFELLRQEHADCRERLGSLQFQIEEIRERLRPLRSPTGEGVPLALDDWRSRAASLRSHLD